MIKIKYILIIFLLFNLINKIWANNKTFSDIFKFTKNIKLREGENYLIGSIRDFCVKDNKIYICDSKSSDVKIYSMDGILINKIGEKGKGPGEFMAPTAIAVDDKNIFIGDIESKKLSIFNKNNNTYIKDFPLLDVKEIEVFNNNIFVSYSDFTTKTMLHIFNKNGKLIKDLFNIPKIAVKNNLICDNISFDLYKNNIFLIHEMKNKILIYNTKIKNYKEFSINSPKYKSPTGSPIDINLGLKKINNWIESWTHLLKVDYIENTNLILVMSVNYSNNKKNYLIDFININGKNFYSGISTNLRYLGSDNNENLFFLEEIKNDNKIGFIIKQFKLKIDNKIVK